MKTSPSSPPPAPLSLALGLALLLLSAAARAADLKLAATPPTAASANPATPPQGLSSSDWSGIRGAYKRGRHAIVDTWLAARPLARSVIPQFAC